MAVPFPSGQLAYLCENARNLVVCAAHHKNDLDALEASAEAEVRRAETALTDALDGTPVSSEGQRALLSIQLQRSLQGVQAARQLCIGAREQHAAASDCWRCSRTIAARGRAAASRRAFWSSMTTGPCVRWWPGCFRTPASR